MERHVTFLGKQNHVERLIPRVHVLLMPSEMESFGLAALEAMACGVPPVATRVGGLPELVTHGVDGFLEPVAISRRKSRRVIELLTNEELHQKMADAARRTAVERFASSMIIPQYEKYYEEVMANGPKLIAVAMIGAAMYGQDAKPVIDNESVTVWDVTWTKGQTNPARGHDLDAVVMSGSRTSWEASIRRATSAGEASEGGNAPRSLVDRAQRSSRAAARE